MLDFFIQLYRRLRYYSRRGEYESGLDEEMRFHLRMKIDQNLAAGMSPAQARRAARQEFGNLTLLGEASREMWTFNWIEHLWRDVQYGLRVLRKSPGFTAVAVVSLALGIGANTAIFQLLDAVRLRTLPVDHPEQLASVQIADMRGARGRFNSPYPSVGNPIWEQIRDRQEAFSGIFAWGTASFDLTQGGEARFARALWVSGDFFHVLGIQPALGRVFTAADDRRDCGTPGAVISYAFWQSEFGGDPAAIGRKLVLSDHPVEIIGVAPRGFFGLEVGKSFDLAVPICSEPILRGEGSQLNSGTSWWLMVAGRLKPGWSVGQATAHLKSISPDVFKTTLAANYPAENVKDYLGFKLEAAPAGTGLSRLREEYESPLWLLLAIVGTVLLIACANLANLMLARAGVREREIAVRLALGASRGRLVRQMLTESLLLAAAGAVVGALLAGVLGRFLVSFLGSGQGSVYLETSVSWRVLLFTGGVAVLTCILFGLVPAMRATRLSPGSVMKASGRGLTAGRERFGLRRLLVVTQIALSLILLVGALLFSRSLGKLQAIDPGFRQDGVLVIDAGFGRLKLASERRRDFKRELLARLRATPGVESVADTDVVPISGSSGGNAMWMDGAEPRNPVGVSRSWISSGYFKTLMTTILAGRDFDDRDTISSPKVAIVNEVFARELTGGANPVGRSLWVQATPASPETRYEIVGLVRNTKYNYLNEEFLPIAFFPLSQDRDPDASAQLLIRSTGPLEGLTAELKRVFAEISPEISLEFQVFKREIEGSLLRERLMAALSGIFGLLAVLLACIGLYGIMSYGVVSRTNEIGIRMALGANRGSVVWLILREALMLAVVGVMAGAPALWAVPRLVSTLLYGVKLTDPLTLAAGALSMIGVALGSAYLPAWRASRVDPMVALRQE